MVRVKSNKILCLNKKIKSNSTDVDNSIQRIVLLNNIAEVLRMKRSYIQTFGIVLTIFIFAIMATASLPATSYDSLRIADDDMPSGFVYGQIPDFAKKVLKGNPWDLDRAAINRLTDRIYPDGTASRVKAVHMTILARKKNPFSDDIVCYILHFYSPQDAQKEFKKLKNYVDANNDRAVVIMQHDIAMFFHVDDTSDFGLIYDMAEKAKAKMKAL